MPFSRRELLRNFGLTLGSLPLLDALRENAAWAGPAVGKRLICITIPHGIFTHHWVPFVPTSRPISSSSPGAFMPAPSQYLKRVEFEQREGCTAIDLPTSGAMSPILSAKWQALRPKMAFVNNLSCSNAFVQGHTATAMLGGYRNNDTTTGVPGGTTFTGETIDVLVARKLNGSLPLVLRCPDYRWDATGPEEAYSHSVYRVTAEKMDFVPALRDPQKTWDLLFSSYMPPDPGSLTRDPAARKLALLERTLTNLARLKRDSRLSSVDVQRVENHTSLVSAQRAELLKTTSTPKPSDVTPPPRPVAMTTDESQFFSVKTELFKAQFKNASTAVKMNKAAVVCVNAGLENGWLDGAFNLAIYHGDAGHFVNPGEGVMEQCRKVQQFAFDTIAEFLTELDVLEDPSTGATYLDNSMVLITTEHDGRPNGHLRGAIPSILVGGFGTFTPGKLYDYSRPALWLSNDANVYDHGIYKGFTYARLLRTIAASFQLSSSEMANMSLQGQANDWNGADTTDWTKPLTGLV